MPNGKEYRQGLRDGATQTNIDDLRKSVDGMWCKIDQLPCGKVSAEVDAIKASLKKHWVLMILLLSEQAAIIALVIKLIDYVAKKQ